jgi:hypothetical protein
MNDINASKIPAMRRILSGAAAAALAAVVAVSLSQPAHAGNVTPPPVPTSIQVPEGNVPYLVGHATGTQNYVCVPKDGSFAWTLYTPQATLFRDSDRQIITHFFSPNPAATNEFLPTWQHSRDTSAVWVKAAADPYAGADFVEPGAVAWLLLRVVTADGGPAGGDALTGTTFIHRLNTSGGVAPSTGCAGLEDVGQKRFIPYTADYYFYEDAED